MLGKLKGVQARVETIMFGMGHSKKKIQQRLNGREFILETDPSPVVHLNKSKVTNPRLMHGTLSLQPYRFRIIAIKGKDNVGADYLSRLKIHAKFSRWLKVLRTISKDGCNSGNKITFFFLFHFILEF